jgi:hypothetical protein
MSEGMQCFCPKLLLQNLVGSEDNMKCQLDGGTVSEQ